MRVLGLDIIKRGRKIEEKLFCVVRVEQRIQVGRNVELERSQFFLSSTPSS